MNKIFNEEIIKNIDQFQVDLPPDDWNALLSKIDTKRRIIPMWWYPVAASISIIIGIGIVMSIMNNADRDVNLIAKKFHYEQNHITKGISNKKNKIILENLRNRTSKNSNKILLTQKSYPKVDISENPIETPIEQIDNSSAIDDRGHLNVSSKTVVPKAQIDISESLDEYANSFENNTKPNNNLANDYNRLFLKNGYIAANTSVLPSKINSGGIRSGSEVLLSRNGQSIISPFYSKKSHYLPISAGFMVGIPIIDRLSVNTGLQYTYLFSKQSNYENASNKLVSTNDQNLHYLGIPINVSFKILNKRVVQLYVSNGITLDKGISKINLYHYYDPDVPAAERHIQESEKIKGVQISLNASLGVNITLYKGLGLYIEPKISWYIPNTQTPQPESKITTNPLLFNIAAGLRWDFGKK